MKSLEHKLILIGASTGGPAHIEKILCALQEPMDFTVIIAQHMGSEFLPSFIKRLALKTHHSIELAQDKEIVQSGTVYIADRHCALVANGSYLEFRVTTPSHAPYNPEINYLFRSAAKLAPKYKLLATLLTGIGDDGVEGCLELSQNGIKCIAESQKTAIVYGMPARAKERIPSIQVMDLDDIIREIQNFGEY